MGVLNFSAPVRRALQNTSGAQRLDLLTFVQEQVFEAEPVPPPPACSSRSKRKRTKSGSSNGRGSWCYDSRDYGVDERRKGARHQRRRQNSIEIGSEEDEEIFDSELYFDNRNTAFSELFQNEEKMKVWEDFVDLSDEEQFHYVQNQTNGKASDRADVDFDQDSNPNQEKYLLIDQKLRDVLGASKPGATEVLKYYEDLIFDFLSPAVILLDVDSAFDRMLVYAVCQYLALASTTIKMQSSTFIEVDVEGKWDPPSETLYEFLKRGQ